MYEATREEILGYFLTEFPTGHPPAYLENIVREFLAADRSVDWIEVFWSHQGALVRQELLEEFNRRIQLKEPLRFEPIDDIGTRVRGRCETSAEREASLFQDALLDISPREFEQLSARILRWAGCLSVWTTPQSHDEGLDAFGILPLELPRLGDPDAAWPVVTMLAQAKHYRVAKVGSSVIRELVGSAVLAEHHIYSSAAPKYEDLDLKPFGPAALLLVSSGDVARAARSVARKAGVFLVTAADIQLLFKKHWRQKHMRKPRTTEEVLRFVRQELTNIPVAS